MLGESRIKQLLETALALSTADETEAAVTATDESLTRFANNAIHQNVAESDAAIEVRAVFGKRVGTAVTNDFSADSLRRIVDMACEIARHQPENPGFPGLPEPSPVARVESFDEAAASASPEQRAAAVSGICRAASGARAVAAGAYSTSITESAIANSRGLFAYHPATSVDLTLVVARREGSGYAHGTSWRLDRVDTERLGQEALRKALASSIHDPMPLDPGEYPVILEPYAVADIIENLASAGMGALAVQEGRSWMNGRMGKQILSPLISIWDDGLDTDGEPQPFDCEGVPKRRVDIVRDGAPIAPVYDTHTAAREPGRASTGHAQPIDEDWDGPAPANLHMAPGESSVEAMIAATERGVYVTRFWYVNAISERNCMLTGMTRDGTFLIEGGEIAGPVRNARFTQAMVPALKHVAALSREARPIGGYYGSHRLPAMKLDGFRFTG
ncbi:MAG: TldD/PmbA family protein [Chloroflexi bacterium]|nr:TldD/PmbA family protein [Chloroflexota bacterium]